MYMSILEMHWPNDSHLICRIWIFYHGIWNQFQELMVVARLKPLNPYGMKKPSGLNTQQIPTRSHLATFGNLSIGAFLSRVVDCRGNVWSFMICWNLLRCVNYALMNPRFEARVFEFTPNLYAQQVAEISRWYGLVTKQRYPGTPNFSDVCGPLKWKELCLIYGHLSLD